MRTLKVASLVGLAPLLLILPTFLAFLLLAHCQAWCQPLYEISPTLSTWNSTATTLLPIQVTTPPPSYTMDNTTTISSSFRPSSLLQTWLKRWRHSKRKSPALWILCGGTFLFCSMYLHKVRHSPAIKVAFLYVGKIWVASSKSHSITTIDKRPSTTSYKTPRSKKARKRSNNKNKKFPTSVRPCSDDNGGVQSTSDWIHAGESTKTPLEDAPSNNKETLVIQRWYSPFSTGLDLALVSRSDPLIHLDPIRNPPCELHSLATTSTITKRHQHTYGAIGQAIPSF